MSKILSVEEKIRLIKKAKKGGNVSEICKKVQVSRAIFYKWLKTYEKAGRRAKKKSLTPKYLSGSRHWKKLSSKIEKRIIKIAIKTPSLSPQKIAKIVGISKSGVFSVLKKNNLNTRQLREDYIFRNTKSLVKEKPISYKVTMVRRHEVGDRVSDICRDFDVSRTIFYRWLKRYSAKENFGEEVQREALESLRPKGEKHWRYVPEAKNLVLGVVVEHPEFSVHKISKYLFQKQNKHILSSYGVHTLLKRLDLNTYNRRLAYAKTASETAAAAKGTVPQVSEGWKAPIFGQIPSVSALAPPFDSAQGGPSGFFKKLISSKFFLPILSVVLISFVLSVVLSNLQYGQGIVGKIGILFSFVALFLGMFFFIYSLKYYLTIAIVLSFSRGKDSSTGSGQGRGPNQVPGLRSDISSIRLERHPFVSIHIASYNEKRVVERLLKAVTSMDYDNYEVVIADDSNDDTTLIIENYLKSQSSNVKTTTQNSNPSTLTTAEVRPGLTIKYLHRSSRSGFKGGALKGALEHTDPRAEYILIFDADFIPYADTITQFLKYFQSTAGTLDFSSENIASLLNCSIAKGNDQVENNNETMKQCNNRIAAIQGYQWHVLNKSENWITRGVRSEYSGSYVIERSGEEIYSGLKQISGSVYMIRRSVLESIGWGTSITEDFELTLKLYEKGYKVVYTPYIQAPAEAASTIKRLIRQRMRWAEGHSHNIKKMFGRLMFGKWESPSQPISSGNIASLLNCSIAASPLSPPSEGGDEGVVNNVTIKQSNNGKRWVSSPLSLPEKLEFLYLSPYYLQAAFFIFGTLSWFIAEVIFKVRLPFWTEIWGWSLVFTNLLALPMMNMIGLFLEESGEKDYLGIFSFIVLSYIVAPFQGYASVKGFLAKEEGPWFRTPKTGRITDTFVPGRFYRFVTGIFGRPTPSTSTAGISNFKFQISNQFSILKFSNSKQLAFASSHTSTSLSAFSNFSNFRIKRRTVRWVGNTTLALFLITTIFLTSFAPFIGVSGSINPGPKPAFASMNSSSSNLGGTPKVMPDPSRRQEITTPVSSSYFIGEDETLSYIFHKEPRVRTVINEKGIEIESRLDNFPGLGKASPRSSYREKGKFYYDNIVEGVNLRYIPDIKALTEEVILTKPMQFSGIEYQLKTIDLTPKLKGKKVIVEEKNGKEFLVYNEPFMYEEGNPKDKNYGIKYILEKNGIGYKLQKVLTDGGKRWLSDPKRKFPVVIDPTAVNSVIQSPISASETGWLNPKRNVQFFPNATGGAAWYAVYHTGTTSTPGTIGVEKCAQSTGCDATAEWTVVTSDLDNADADTDNMAASTWKEGDTLYTAWHDDSRDAYQFNTINTTTDGLGTTCNGADIGSLALGNVSIAVADDGDVFIALAANGSGGTAERVSKIASGGCTETNITTAAMGFDQGDRTEMLTIGNNALLMFAADNGLRSSGYDDTAGAWDVDTDDIDVNGATADNTATDVSAVTDGTDVWVIQRNGTTGNSETFKCSACSVTTANTWTDIAEPWGSGMTASSHVGLSYLSSTNQLAVVMLDDTGSDTALSKSTDADTISWGSQFSFAGGGVTEINNFGMTANVVNDTQVAIVYLDTTNSEIEFATVPENLWLLLLLSPFLPKVLRRLRRKDILPFWAGGFFQEGNVHKKNYNGKNTCNN